MALNFGLPSWINQRLYACYIGAEISAKLVELIESGKLTFPNSPAEKSAAMWQAHIEKIILVIEKICTEVDNDEYDENELAGDMHSCLDVLVALFRASEGANNAR